MWRYVVGINRGRIQCNGVIRSSPQTLRHDDRNELCTDKQAEHGRRVRAEYEKEYGERFNRAWRNMYFRGCRFNYSACNSRWIEAFILSTSFILSCQLSQLWKIHKESDQRKNIFLYEVLKTSRLGALCNGVEKDKSSLLHSYKFPLANRDYLVDDPGEHVLNKQAEALQIFSQQTEESAANKRVKKVQFESDVTETEYSGIETTESTTRRVDLYHEQIYADFELQWSKLCSQYGQLKRNVLGVQSVKDDDWPGAMNHFQASSLAGCARAYFNLALIHERGICGVKDEDQAILYYEKAVELGNASAAHNLALIYLNRDSKDISKAKELLGLASKQGLALAKTELGVIHLEEGNLKSAATLFQEAASLKDSDGQYFLAVCYEHGWGVPRSECKAAEWYQHASESGHSHAQYQLAVFLEQGLGGLDKNEKTAFTWYEKSAQSGNYEAVKRIKRESLSQPTECLDSPRMLRSSFSAPTFTGQPEVITKPTASRGLRKSSTVNHDLDVSMSDVTETRRHIRSDNLSAKDVQSSFNDKKSVFFSFYCDDDDNSLDSWSSPDLENTKFMLHGDFGQVDRVTKQKDRKKKYTGKHLDRGPFWDFSESFDSSFYDTSLDSLISTGGSSIVFEDSRSSAHVQTA